MHHHLRTQLAVAAAALFASACQSSSSPTQSAEAEKTVTSGGSPEKSTPAKADTMPTAPEAGEVKCLGIHECKGKSACHVIGGHACAGQNDCKGKGWIVVPKEECDSKGGKVLDS